MKNSKAFWKWIRKNDAKDITVISSWDAGYAQCGEDKDGSKYSGELEDMIVRLHNIHPGEVGKMLLWWRDMFRLMPQRKFKKEEERPKKCPTCKSDFAAKRNEVLYARPKNRHAICEDRWHDIAGNIQKGGADTCKWIEDSNGWTHTSCGATPFKISPYPTEEQMCGHCRKPIRISEGDADTNPPVKGEVSDE